MEIISSSLTKCRYIQTTSFNAVVLHIHHIIVDEVTLRRVSCTLKKLLNIEDNISNAAALSYSTFVASEDKYLESNDYKLDQDFWREKYKLLPPEVNLSLMPVSESAWKDTCAYSAKHLFRPLSANETKQISDISKELGITEFVYYFACISVVLQRYLGVDDVSIAVPVSLRDDLHQTTDGLFVNTLLYRIKVDPKLTWRQHILATADEYLLYQKYRQYPLEKLAQWIWTTHKRSVGSFCSLMFNYSKGDYSSDEIRVNSKHAKMSLSIDVIIDQRNGRSGISFEWAEKLIDDSIISRLADSIHGICSKKINIEERIIDSEILSSSEIDLLRAFSTGISLQTFNCFLEENMHLQLKHHTKQCPNNIAIISEQKSLTYIQLDEMSSQIANGLCLEVDDECLQSKPVLLFTQKDDIAIAAIIGIWKAGGYFLPLSLSNSNNLRDIGKHSPLAAVLFRNSVSKCLSKAGLTCPLISLESLLENTTNNEKVSLEKKNSIAYAIRTSGSTGIPKVCEISHQNLNVIAKAWKHIYNMEDYQVNVFQWAPLSFDVFVGDVVRALICVPGTLILCPDEKRLDLSYIQSKIRVQNITMIEVTPHFALHLIESAKEGDLDSLQVLVVGSDVTQRHVFERIKSILKPGQRIINSYGMTEATIDSSFFEDCNIPCTRTATVPIGKPLPGVVMDVLDPKTLLPTPVGTIGELFISGNVIASGDVDVVKLERGGKIALKTGDICSWLPSGNLELHGRSNDVIKLRGFRISTSEIERHIVKQITGVKVACVVILSDENTSLQHLCAFIELEPNGNILINSKAVKQILSKELPNYMVPDFIHICEKLPLTNNGKLDRKSLPKLTDLLEKKLKDTRLEINEKESATVVALKTLFAQAMDIEDKSIINTQLTFMENGAHSLILIRFCSLLKQKTKFQVGIADLFSYPSILSLANHIDKDSKLKTAVKNETFQFLPDSDQIAITGLGIRLPSGIMSLSQLWEVLGKGKDLIKNFPESRLKDAQNCLSFLSTNEKYKGAFLANIDQFDHNFFRIPPGEAKFMSPEQRLLLEVATEAVVEGRDVEEINGSNIGVFLSHVDIGYSQLEHPDEAICVSGLLPGMVATRIAYQWNLKGPSMLVDTACSSSLMALKQACEAIKRNECEGALVGGANLVIYPERSGVFGNTGILSPDFCCRAFDTSANGTAVGEGVLCLHIEKLSTATNKGKHIYGIVQSVAANSVGHGNGITAPSANSQADVINAALESANITASDVSYVETHGTGTKLGDSIELSALSSVFNEASNVIELKIGTSKSMFGHLDSSAGLLGLIKVLAAIKFNKIPPSANFKNPKPELEASILSVSTEIAAWNHGDTKRKIAGVSAFGLTGTNCHAIISEHVPVKKQHKSITSTEFPLLIRGKDFVHIKSQASLYKSLIEQTIQKSENNTLEGVCRFVARKLHELSRAKLGHNQYRMAIITKSPEQAIRSLSLVQKAETPQDLLAISKIRSDINISFPKFDVVCKDRKAVQSFICRNEIDIYEIFGKDTENSDTCTTFGVALGLFSESRHWLDPTNRSCFEQGNLDDLLIRKLTESKELIRTIPLKATDELKTMEGRFCSAIIIKLLISTDLVDHMKHDKETTLTEAFETTGMLKKYDKLFFVMIRELLENGFVKATGVDKIMLRLDSFIFKCSHFLEADPREIANYAMKQFPIWSDCFRFPLYCSQYLQSVLWGKMSPLSVIYPHGDLNFMYRFDKLGDPLGDVYYNTYLQIIASHAMQLATCGKKVRILEVGAGMGHVTRQLLPKLKDTVNIEYWFTDLGKAFVENAKTTFENFLHFMKFSTFDITKNAPQQGVMGSFDIVLSYNVIHTTESIKDSVLNLKSCLGNDGTLFIIESAKNETWATLAWGVLDGWWYFKDYDLRPFEPMMEPEKWENTLKGMGFTSVVSCPFDEGDLSEIEKCMFVCSMKPLKRPSQVQTYWWETIDLTIQKHQELKDDPESLSSALTNEIAYLDREIVQKELKNIWIELLGVENINPEDDFNSLGGESLLAVQMMTLVRKRIGYQLEIADTFGYPTLGALADFIFCGIQKEINLKPVTVSSPTNGPEQEDIKTVSVCPVKETNFRTMIMFPGQGAQKFGMCCSMENSVEARAIFNRAEKILGYDILQICLEKDDYLKERLKSTEFVQVSLFVGCLAKLRQIEAEDPNILQSVSYVAGLSIGEFSALVYADVMNFEDALEIVRQRGKAMEAEVKRSASAMASVFGPNLNELQNYIKEKFTNLEISTFLADNQHTVAGSEDDINSFVDALNSKDKEAMNVVDVRKLRVAGAFHSSYMETAAIAVDPLIDAAEFRKPRIPVIMNATGKACVEPSEIKLQLREQLVSPVQWKKTIVAAYENDVRQFIEIAPSRVLSSIVQNRISHCKGSIAKLIEV